MHLNAEDEPTIKRNEAALNNLHGKLFIIEANCCKYSLVFFQAAQNQKQTNAGGLPKLLNLKIGAKVILTANID